MSTTMELTTASEPMIDKLVVYVSEDDPHIEFIICKEGDKDGEEVHVDLTLDQIEMLASFLNTVVLRRKVR